MGAGIVAIGLAPTFALALVAAAIGGAGNGLNNVSESSVIQARSPAEALGGVFGMNQGLVQCAIALGTLVGAPSVNLVGASHTMIIFGGAAAVSAGIALFAALTRKEAIAK